MESVYIFECRKDDALTYLCPKTLECLSLLYQYSNNTCRVVPQHYPFTSFFSSLPVGFDQYYNHYTGNILINKIHRAASHDAASHDDALSSLLYDEVAAQLDSIIEYILWCDVDIYKSHTEEIIHSSVPFPVNRFISWWMRTRVQFTNKIVSAEQAALLLQCTLKKVFLLTQACSSDPLSPSTLKLFARLSILLSLPLTLSHPVTVVLESYRHPLVLLCTRVNDSIKLWPKTDFRLCDARQQQSEETVDEVNQRRKVASRIVFGGVVVFAFILFVSIGGSPLKLSLDDLPDE
eukprot:GHVR01178770.1.p1 GENE.GHVR01178770.1~~GHVR01178770.1.p1  ORF type:complete len:292 (+),score=47.80 GHVR01178770.1:23-898(+)